MKIDKLKFTKKTIKRASLIAFSVTLIGFFFLVKKHLIISNNPITITIQLCAVIIMIWARITFGMRSFHASANSSKGELVTNGPFKWFRHPIYASIIYFFFACIISFPKIETIIGVFLIITTLAIIQAYISKSGNYLKDPFTFGGIDLMVIQKIILSLFFMVLLNRIENYRLQFLDIIATNSFGIYFIHGILIWVIETIKRHLDFSFTSNSFLIYCLVASLIFLISLFITISVKRIFPKNSRLLIGS